jgi:hypothetical protein
MRWDWPVDVNYHEAQVRGRGGAVWGFEGSPRTLHLKIIVQLLGLSVGRTHTTDSRHRAFHA